MTGKRILQTGSDLVIIILFGEAAYLIVIPSVNIVGAEVGG